MLDQDEAVIVENERQISELLDSITGIASRNFDKRANIDGPDETLNALALGINMLSEEVEYSTIDSNYFNTIFHAMPNILLVCDETGMILRVNKPIENYGFTESDILGKSITIISEKLQEFISNDKIFSKEINFICRNGRETSVLVSRSILYKSNCASGQEKKEFLLVLNDLSSLKSAQAAQKIAEDRLQQAQKIEAIGRLAGGIAHDFNNITGSILGHIELIKRYLIENNIADKKLDKYIAIIEKCSHRSSDLTKKLLGFARKGNYEMQQLDISAALQEIIDILERTIETSIKISANFDQELWLVVADPVQIMQVFMNLALNSRDAMPNGGEIFYKACNIIPSYQYCKTYNQLIPFKRYVKITVGDIGEGIKKEHLEEIFEPFFTTKEVGKGTGLGLSMAYGIIKAHNGCMYVNSTVGVGTKFSIYLPAIDQNTAAIDYVTKERSVAKKALNKTILVVDDEVLIRELTEAALVEYGCKVISASSGVEAIKILKKERGKIDCILLDVIMPEMNGYDFFVTARKIVANIPVLFCSGYAESDKISRLRHDKKVEFIQKPFELDDLYYSIKNIV